MEEILQTGGGSKALALLFEELLVPGGKSLFGKARDPVAARKCAVHFPGCSDGFSPGLT
jgi:hypothetical protein